MKIDDIKKVLTDSQTGQGSYGPNYDGAKLAAALWGLIDAAQAEAVPAPEPVGTIPRMCEFKTDELLKRGFKKIGYILARDDSQQFALSDSSVRWLSQPQYFRLMHEQDGSLFADKKADAPAPSLSLADVSKPTYWVRTHRAPVTPADVPVLVSEGQARQYSECVVDGHRVFEVAPLFLGEQLRVLAGLAEDLSVLVDVEAEGTLVEIYDREVPVYSQFHEKPVAEVVMSDSNPEVPRGDLGDPSTHLWVVETWMPDESLPGNESSQGTGTGLVNKEQMVWIANAAGCKALGEGHAKQVERQCRQFADGTTKVVFTESNLTRRKSKTLRAPEFGIAKSRMKFDIRGKGNDLFGRVEIYLVEVERAVSEVIPSASIGQ